MSRESTLASAAFALAVVALLFPGQASAKGAKTFLASDDAKESDEPQAYLPDYAKLVKGADADWVYFPNGSLKPLKTVRIQPFSCLLYTSPSPRDYAASRMPSSA